MIQFLVLTFLLASAMAGPMKKGSMETRTAFDKPTNHPSQIKNQAETNETTRQSNRAEAMDRAIYCTNEDQQVTITAKFWYVSDFDGGQDNAEAVVEKFIETTNTVLSNSEIATTYQKWGSVQELPLTNEDAQSGDGKDNELFIDSLGTDLASYEYLKQSADVIVLLYNHLSYPNRCAGFDHDDAWWTTYWTIVVTGTMDNDLTFAHEAGHCMGAMHNREESVRDEDDINYGYCLPGTPYGTVMTYLNTCTEGQNTRIPYYSNPEVSYEGHPTGTATDNNALVMMDQKYNRANAGTNCANGKATDKSEVVNECKWGEDGAWHSEPWSKCCCEEDLYEETAQTTSQMQYLVGTHCYHYIPGFDYGWIAEGQRKKISFKNCFNLLGDAISPWQACTFSNGDWYTFAEEECDCSDPCGTGAEPVTEEPVTEEPVTEEPTDCATGCTCATDTDDATIPVTGEAGDTFNYEFRTLTELDGEETYQNTGFKIKTSDSGYYGSTDQLLYTRGSAEGAETLEAGQTTLYFFVHPYTDMAWDLTVCKV